MDLNKQLLNREVDVADPVWQEIRDRLYIFFLTRWSEVQELYQDDLGVFSVVVEAPIVVEHVV